MFFVFPKSFFFICLFMFLFDDVQWFFKSFGALGDLLLDLQIRMFGYVWVGGGWVVLVYLFGWLFGSGRSSCC